MYIRTKYKGLTPQPHNTTGEKTSNDLNITGYHKKGIINSISHACSNFSPVQLAVIVITICEVQVYSAAGN